MAKLALFLVLVLSANVALSQDYDYSENPFLSCPNFLVSTGFEIACPDNTPSSPANCDAHCQCIHGSVWGQCENRTASDPPGTPGLNNLLCRCYPAPATRPAWSTQMTQTQCNQGLITNQLVAAAVCSNANICTADCICSHGTKSGACQTVGGIQHCVCAN